MMARHARELTRQVMAAEEATVEEALRAAEVASREQAAKLALLEASYRQELSHLKKVP